MTDIDQDSPIPADPGPEAGQGGREGGNPWGLILMAVAAIIAIVLGGEVILGLFGSIVGIVLGLLAGVFALIVGLAGGLFGIIVGLGAVFLTLAALALSLFAVLLPFAALIALFVGIGWLIGRAGGGE